MIEGVNVENAAYPLGVCAERTAFARAIAEGYRPGDFVAAAITASPCGGCRQWLLEMQVGRVVFRNDGRVVTTAPDELLPESFEVVDAARGRLSLHALDTMAFPLRDGFLVTIAVGGGPGVPHRKAPVNSGIVVVAGRPNVREVDPRQRALRRGVAITSDVPNTTRRRIFGVANGPGYQLALVDLPGFQRPLDPLTERMQRTVDSAFEDVDAVLLVVDARARIGAGDRFVARRVFALGTPVLIALNKIDRLKGAHVLSQMQAAAALGDFHALHPVSAKTKRGRRAPRRPRLAPSRRSHVLPRGPADGPMTVEERIAEVVHEKALRLTREEVPHALMVEVDAIEEAVVRAHVYVETESQKGILVGKRGAMVREIGTRARPGSEAPSRHHPVFLELVVKVRPKWRRDPRFNSSAWARRRQACRASSSVASSPSSSAISRASRPCPAARRRGRGDRAERLTRRREGRGHAICGALGPDSLHPRVVVRRADGDRRWDCARAAARLERHRRHAEAAELGGNEPVRALGEPHAHLRRRRRAPSPCSRRSLPRSAPRGSARPRRSATSSGQMSSGHGGEAGVWARGYTRPHGAKAPALIGGFELPTRARGFPASAPSTPSRSRSVRPRSRSGRSSASREAPGARPRGAHDGPDDARGAGHPRQDRRPLLEGDAARRPTDLTVPPVAAVCVYPNLVAAAKERLGSSGVKVTSVATAFPSGQSPTEIKVAETRAVVELGADEVDMVIDRGAFLSGRYSRVYDEIVRVKEACGDAHLKVILETGELGTYDNVRRASLLAIAAGADFVKTSTGKISPAATLPVTLCAVGRSSATCTRETGHKVGIKPAGGIRTSKQAVQYLVTLYETLGSEWMTPDLFRFGASSLLNDVLMQVNKERTGRYQSGDYFTID